MFSIALTRLADGTVSGDGRKREGIDWNRANVVGLACLIIASNGERVQEHWIQFRTELTNARNLTGRTVCSQFLFSLSLPASGRWKHGLRTSAFPPPIVLMRSTFSVNSQSESARQSSEYGNWRSIAADWGEPTLIRYGYSPIA